MDPKWPTLKIFLFTVRLALYTIDNQKSEIDHLKKVKPTCTVSAYQSFKKVFQHFTSFIYNIIEEIIISYLGWLTLDCLYLLLLCLVHLTFRNYGNSMITGRRTTRGGSDSQLMLAITISLIGLDFWPLGSWAPE